MVRPSPKRRRTLPPVGGSRLADGLQRGGLRARILNDAVAHAGHPVTGSAQPVSLPSGVRPRVPVADPLQRGADLGLAANHRED